MEISSEPIRTIRRIAFMQEYSNRPHTLNELVPEVAKKGYSEIAVSGQIGDEEVLLGLAKTACDHDLGFMVFTGFMKYQQAHLVTHPEQRMVMSTDADVDDQDAVPIKMGCPFNVEFQKRYFDFLEFLGRIPNLTECWVNDEATFGANEGVVGCYCHVCREDWKQRFGGSIPLHPFKDQQEKNNFVKWRFERWNEVHGQMKEALNKDHRVLAVWLSSPRACWDVNPWISGVDFSGMIDRIDGVNTDPYYTFHLPSVGAGQFKPIEVYLSECSRFISGYTAADDKVGEICAQGFSHPTFTRPLDKRDGWWASVLPPALGVDHITAYTYLLQRAGQMQGGYEEAFRLDPYFSRAKPINLVAIIDSLETQAFDPDVVGTGVNSWRISRMLRFSEVARHQGLPYAYLPSAEITSSRLGEYPVVILPNVTCMSADQRAALQAYVHGGGVLIAAGATASRNESGMPSDNTFLSQVFGISSCEMLTASGEYESTIDHFAFSDLPWPDEITAMPSWGGSRCPVLGLDPVAKIGALTDTQVLANFVSGPDAPESVAGCPALTVRSYGQGTAIFLSGIPIRMFVKAQTSAQVLNFTSQVLNQLILSFAGQHCPVKALNFPPRVPMQDVRPLDPRWMPTMEFLPLVGDGIYLAAVPSYFQEPFEFQIQANLPNGKVCRQVRELVSDKPVTALDEGDGTVEMTARFKPEDYLKVFAFMFE